MRMYKPIYVLELDLSTKTYKSRFLDYTFKRKQFALGGGHRCFKTKTDCIFRFSPLNKPQSVEN